MFVEQGRIEAGSADAYALTSEDFAALAKTYGRMGGLDRIMQYWLLGAGLAVAARIAKPHIPSRANP